MDDNRLLADEHGIPWHQPKDISHFRHYTQGKWLLVGRRTFGEMQGWFTDHTPLILSSQCGYTPAIGRVVASVPQAMAQAEAAEQNELVCCGGGQVYAAALPYADKLVLTRIQHQFVTSSKAIYFPNWNHEEWLEIDRREIPMDEVNPWPMSFVTLERKNFGGESRIESKL